MRENECERLIVSGYHGKQEGAEDANFALGLTRSFLKLNVGVSLRLNQPLSVS